jgi:hypothetical protein
MDNWPLTTSSTEFKVARHAILAGLGSRHCRPSILGFYPQVVTMAGYAILAASSGGHCDIYCLQAPDSGVLNAISVADLGQKLAIPPPFGI